MSRENDVNGCSFQLHPINGYISTIYLVEYPEGLLLLDCGSANDIPRIKAACEKIGRSPVDIKLAVATHAHPDHMGGAIGLREKYAIPIAAHPDIDRWYQGAGGYIQHKIDSFLANWVAFKSGYRLQSVRYKRSVKPEYIIREGRPLPLFPEWQVLYNPGHTLHDVALYHAGSKILYWADSICSVNDRFHLPVPVLFPELMKESLRKMVALEPRQILLAHGGIFVVKNQQLLSEQVDTVMNKDVNPHIERLHSLFLFSPAARRGLKEYAGRH